MYEWNASSLVFSNPHHSLTPHDQNVFPIIEQAQEGIEFSDYAMMRKMRLTPATRTTTVETTPNRRYSKKPRA